MLSEAISSDDLLARVLHRDGLMLVIDKPAGLPVHRGPKGGGSIEDYFDVLRFGLPRPPSLAHRLDKDTSGCLVLGRHRKALAHLGLLFKHGKVGKTYWAVVEGGPAADEGTIDLPLGRLDETRGWWMKPDPDGLPAVTTWRVLGRTSAGAAWPGATRADAGTRLERSQSKAIMPCEGGASSNPSPWAVPPSRAGGAGSPGGACHRPGQRPDPLAGDGTSPRPNLTWLALTPVTGRTHQLRVHCAAAGWPIVGDSIYGNGPRFGEPVQHLHAREVVIPISKNKHPVRITAPVPPHMRQRLQGCGWNGEDYNQKY